jgi:hypothetical protein
VIPNNGSRRRPRRSNGQTPAFASTGLSDGTSGWAIVNYCPSPTSSRLVAEDSATENHAQRLSPVAGPSSGPSRSPTTRHGRYAPYPDAPLPAPTKPVANKHHLSPFIPPPDAPLSRAGAFTLPPVQDPVSKPGTASNAMLALPPISTLAQPQAFDARAVLERLRAEDEPQPSSPIVYDSERRMSLDEQMHWRSQALLTSS